MFGDTLTDLKATTYGFIVYIFMFIGAIVAPILCLIYGILALVPTGPFDHQNITLGVTFIVLSLVGIMSVGGCIGGAIIGAIIGSPIACCCNA